MLRLTLFLVSTEEEDTKMQVDESELDVRRAVMFSFKRRNKARKVCVTLASDL